MSRLRIVTPDGHSRDVVLGPGRTTIGRSGECTLPVDHPTLSRVHAAVECQDGVWTVVDLGARNGVRSGGRSVARASLRPGDRFQCGKVEFELLEAGATVVDAPVPAPAAPAPEPAPPPAAVGAPPPPAAPATGDPAGTGDAADPSEGITAEIPEVGRGGITAVVVGAVCALGIAGAVLFMLSADDRGRGTPARKTPPPGSAASAPAPPPVPVPAVVVPEPPPVDAVPTERPDPEALLPGEVRVRFRDGTARVGRVTAQDRFHVALLVRTEAGEVQESWPIEEILRIGETTVRPDWRAVFGKRLEEAGEDREALLALEGWCRRYGQEAGRREVLARLGRGETPAPVPPTAARVRYGGRDWDAQELRAAGKVDARGRLVMAPEDLRYLRDVSFDLLGRSPLDAEVQLAAAETRAQTVDRLTRTPEAWETWYEEELYYFLLLDNFRPATPRLTTIPQKLAAGTLTLPAAMQEIVISQYFNHRNPGNDTFVTVVLEQLLGMVVQNQPMLLATGKKMYDGYEGKLFGETGRSQADLVSIVLRQRVFIERVLDRQHRRLTGAAIPPAVLERNVERVAADAAAYPEVMKEWLLDDAYMARALMLRRKSDHQFIRSLYVELLGRRATYEEFRLFRNALQALADPGPIRSVLAKVLVDSRELKVEAVKDSRQWVGDLFVRMLGRAPTAAELESFGKAAADGHVRQAIQAIVDSSEYQGY